jgi:hypothetical protein
VGIAQKYHLTRIYVLKRYFKNYNFFSQIRKIPQSWRNCMRYLIIKCMVQKRMSENFCYADLIRNFMVFIEPEAQSHKNSRNVQKPSIFCDIAEILSYRKNTPVNFVKAEKIRNSVLSTQKMCRLCPFCSLGQILQYLIS